MATLKVIRNADGTVTVRVGRAVEHIDATNKDKAQLFDAVKWAARSKGASVSDEQLTTMLHRPSGVA